ncbi:hypothetical protein MJN54_30985, partial [Salmonella enterica subsp. enterica serovar Kentucky]|nr:hypothetical protein [Salmonella enterica subsp. enterica serovar Kentucky]
MPIRTLSPRTNETTPSKITKVWVLLSSGEQIISLSLTNSKRDSANAAGQHRNVLFEERDRHIKERLYCVAKIETFARLINALQA